MLEAILYYFHETFLVMSSILRIHIHNTYKLQSPCNLFKFTPFVWCKSAKYEFRVAIIYPCGRHDILAEMFKARKYPATKGSAGDEEGSA